MYPRQYHPAVIVTIDRAGRIVVPKRLRERFNLVAGTELEMVASGDCLQLRRASAEPALVRKKGILVHHGGARGGLDVAAFIRAQREARFTLSPDTLDAIEDVVRRRGESPAGTVEP